MSLQENAEDTASFLVQDANIDVMNMALDNSILQYTFNAWIMQVLWVGRRTASVDKNSFWKTILRRIETTTKKKIFACL